MGTGVLVGYARVSTLDQKPELQLDALKAGGCAKVSVEKASGAKEDRPHLIAALDYLRAGDMLVVWKLDRLARSLWFAAGCGVGRIRLSRSRIDGTSSMT